MTMSRRTHFYTICHIATLMSILSTRVYAQDINDDGVMQYDINNNTMNHGDGKGDADAHEDIDDIYTFENDTRHINIADPLVVDTIRVEAEHARDIYRQSSPFIQTISTETVASINDWIEQAPGVFGDSTGKGQRLVYVRGFSTRQITARFDNMPIDTGYDGITGLDAIPMNWIGKGEIKHADAYSDDAVGLGGSIIMHPVMPKKMQASFETTMTGGRFALGHGMSYGAWDWALTAGAHYSNGFRLSHAFEPTEQEDGGLRDASQSYGANIYGKVARTLGDWSKLEVSGGYTQAPRDVPTGIGTGYYRYWKFTEYHIGLAQAKWSYDTKYIRGFLQAWYQNQGNRLEVFDSPSRTTQTTLVASNSEWMDQDIGAILYLSSQPYSVGLGYMDASLRTEFRYQTHESSEHQIVKDVDVDKSSERLTFDIRPGINWQILPSLFINVSGYAVGDIELAHADTSKDVVVGLVDLYNGGFSAGIDYIPTDEVKVSFRAARRLRMPTLKEQFLRSSGDAFNLNAEIAWNFQLQVDYVPTDKLKFQVTGYDSEVKDLINFRYISGIKEAYNVDEARIAGVDFSTHIGPYAGISLDIAYSFLFSRDLKTDLVLTDRPEHNLRAQISYTPIDSVTLSLRGVYESKRRTEAWLSSKSAWLGGIFTLDAQVDFKTAYFTAYIRGTNLLDYNYARSFGYPEPGFQLFVGATIGID